METQPRTPHSIFMMPQRFLVPLFQRPYVWNQEHQWDPLWRDLERVAQRVLDNPLAVHQPHFLGAVVLQQVQTVAGNMQEWSVIDGQQRLTTLQILLDALHAELVLVGASASAARLDPLIENQAAFCKHPEDRFKVWPTNRDRPAFNVVMGATPPVDHDKLPFKNSKMVQAHRYFSHQAREWLAAGGSEEYQRRADAIERSARELLQMVAIQLTPTENAQEIFETLNARGTPLTVGDLIKNFVFQKLVESGADVQTIYDKQWAQFEQTFWETEVSSGRQYYQRFSLFLIHWLTARTAEAIPAREVFSRFKSYAQFEAGVPISELLNQIVRAAHIYRSFTEASALSTGELSRVDLFSYRSKAMDADVMKPLLLVILDPEQPPLPEQTILSAIGALESWMVRRALVRATAKSSTTVVASLARLLKQGERAATDRIIIQFLTSQTSEGMYWPDDNDLRLELGRLPLYQKMGRGRLRMVLEALEDARRGYDAAAKGFSGMRVARGVYTIEHVMPVTWQHSWQGPEDGNLEDRQTRVHSLGNLTLITHNLNASISNGPWINKTSALNKHSVLLLNSDLIERADDSWTDVKIDNRTNTLVDSVLQVWPVPEGYSSKRLAVAQETGQYVSVADLITAGYLTPGQELFPFESKYISTCKAAVVSDGRIEVNGVLHATPSGAGWFLRNASTNGWGYWIVDLKTRKTLRDVRAEYKQSLDLVDDDTSDEVDNIEAASN